MSKKIIVITTILILLSFIATAFLADLAYTE